MIYSVICHLYYSSWFYFCNNIWIWRGGDNILFKRVRNRQYCLIHEGDAIINDIRIGLGNVRFLTAQIPRASCHWSSRITSSQRSECSKFWSSELLPRVMEFRWTHIWLKCHFRTLQCLTLMWNKSLEFCIKNFLSSVATRRVVLYYSRLDFLPRGTWLVPPTQRSPVSSCPITCYLSFLLA